jgi:hypothetical protein
MMSVVKASNFMTLNKNNAWDGSSWKVTSLPECSSDHLRELFNASGCVLSWSSTFSQSQHAFKVAFEESTARAAEQWNYGFHLASAARRAANLGYWTTVVNA